ncbi:protein of unknown function DUF1405 [Archaeoglobus veneficus SNP6]|uniref:DUF1405 domain-containing protein n=2 Tax=Archaeoglobus veneficus TaxID=58290 RepID=F2KNL0_ARCVS|nr:protein of unknown function DUF1405 [Archaeoglobus veneficus SNP6]
MFAECRMKRLVYFALLANAAGTVYGWYYYHLQLAENPVYTWPVITDSPNSTLLFTVALFLILKGRKSDFLSFAASASLIKYGLWTCFVLLFHSDYFFSPYSRLLYTGIFITHFLMAVEAIPLACTITERKPYFAAVLAWLLFNDFCDYCLGLHPYIPLDGIEVVAAVTLLLSFFSFATAWLAAGYGSKKCE